MAGLFLRVPFGVQQHDPALAAKGLEDLHYPLLGAHVHAAERLV